jgi:YD repeat-containing protein
LKADASVISSFDYEFDQTINRTTLQEATGDRLTWSYDKTYQLTAERRSGANAYIHTFAYDPAGNRLLKNEDGTRTTYAYDAADQLRYGDAATGRTTYTFDANGNQQIVREPNGNRTTNTWNYENQMTLTELPTGQRVTMAYNADNRRVGKEYLAVVNELGIKE